MKPHSQFFYNRIILLLTLIFVAGVTFALYMVFKNTLDILLVGAFVCVVIFVYAALKERQTIVMQRVLSDVSTSVADVASGRSDLQARAKNPLLENFYTELNNLHETIRVKDANRQEILSMVDSIASNMDLEKLLEELLPQLIKVTGSTCGAFYLLNQVTNKLELKHSVGFSKNVYGEFDVTLGEGIIGHSAQTKQIQILNGLPDDTVYLLRTFTGKIKPKSMMIVPVVNQDSVVGVLAMAGLYDYTPIHIEMLDMVKYYVGVAVGNGISYEKTKRMTNELKFQNKLIQELNTDLERKVQERMTFLNDIIDSLKDYAIYATGVDGVINTWNIGASNLLGYKAEEVIGQNIDRLQGGELIRSNGMSSVLEAVMRERKYMESGWRARRDGALSFVESMVVARYDSNNNVVGYTNIIRDLTAFKKMESNLFIEKAFSAKIMSDGATAGFLLLNEKLAVLTMNDSARNLLGASIGDSTRLSGYFTDGADFEAKLNSVLNTAAVETFESVVKSGKVLSVSISLIKDTVCSTKRLCVRIEEAA